MLKSFTVLAAAAAALTSTIGMAQERGERRFTHDGSTYVYTANAAAHGRTVIAGRRLPSGEPFRLVVAGKRVSGVSAGVPVSFRTASAKGAAGGVEIASN